MLKRPAAVPPFDPSRADMRLPEAALKFRTDNQVANIDNLRRLNITAWLYRDRQGVEGIQVNPNTTITQLLAQFGPADTRDAEVGIHSEGQAAEFFRKRPDLQVLQIFTERVPCAAMCAPLLGNYFSGVPVFYYFDRRSWDSSKSAGDVLAGIYGIANKAETLNELQYNLDVLSNAIKSYHDEHVIQLNNISFRKSLNPMGRAVELLNPVATPDLSIWNDALNSARAAGDLLKAGNGAKAGAFILVARMQYLAALKRYTMWKDGINAGAHRAYVIAGTIIAVAAVAELALASVAVAGAMAGGGAITAEGGAAANLAAEQTFTRIELLSDRVDSFIRVASAEGDPAEIIDNLIDESLRAARILP